MPTRITVLKVFIASPSDIIEERNVLEEIVAEINKLIGSDLNLRFEIIKLSTDTYPSIGKDAQSVINEQIGDSYDIFIGLIWKRFGLPTKEGLSGTEEEFIRAYKRAREHPDLIRVMFYFNETPVSISDLDQDQIKKIKDFQASLGEMGVYYWRYKNIDDFARLLRMQLGLVMKQFGCQWGREIATEKEKADSTSQSIKPEENNEEEGLLDLVISSEDEINASTEAMERITVIIKDHTETTEKTTNELNQLPVPKNPDKARSIINRFAEDQDYFVERIKVELPILSKSFRLGIDKWIKSTQMMDDLKEDDKTKIEEALTSVKNFKENIIQVKKSTTSFRDNIQAIPRMTTKLNHSKRNVIDTLNNMIEEFITEENLITEAEKVFLNILENISNL